MNRNHFLKSILGLGLFSTLGCQPDPDNAALERNSEERNGAKAAKALRQELTAAWLRSETMTLTNVDQMPPEFFPFKYTDEAMTFAEQWRHCVMYTCGQLSVGTGIANPYEDVKLPVQMSKEEVIQELKKMYSYVRSSIEALADDQLYADCDFAGDTIPLWRLFYALENHIIHHRGQCIVYLRLNGVIPKGYYGW